MFHTLTLRGPTGSIVWGAGEAATVRGWIATRAEDRSWTLRALVVKSDSYRLRQVPLLFQAPRVSRPRGLWVWPVVPQSLAIANGTLTAKLGPPEGQ